MIGFISSKSIFKNSLALAPVSNDVRNIALFLIPVKVFFGQSSHKAITVSMGTGSSGSKPTLGALTLRIGFFHSSGSTSSSHQYKYARNDR